MITDDEKKQGKSEMPLNGCQPDVFFGKGTGKKRLEYMSALDFIIENGRERVMNRWTKNEEKLAWSRVVVQAVSAGAALLRDHELEELTLRLEAIEERGQNACK